MFKACKAPPSPFEEPTLLHRLISSPLRLLVQIIYGIHRRLCRSAKTLSPDGTRIRVLCISDTHCHKPTSLPQADLLIHAGDLTNAGTVEEIQEQIDWLSDVEFYQHKIVIAGNHDSFFDPRSRKPQDKARGIDWKTGSGIHYLQHSRVELDFPSADGRTLGRTLSIYGAPQIPACGSSDFAFQYERSEDAWSNTVPEDCDILVTHTPPRHHLDLPRGMGCEHLLAEVWRVRPQLHVFGHVHCGHGQEVMNFSKAQQIYELLCQRPPKGLLWDVVDVGAWFGVARLIVHSVIGVLWCRVWGGDEGKTILVNSALVVGSTGRLGNEPQVIEI